MTAEDVIIHYVDRLRRAGAGNVDEYEARLRSNAKSLPTFNSFISEAVAALMFLEYGADVTMRERPDLAVTLGGQKFYAEVKHFKRKIQDDVNDEALRNAPEFEMICVQDTTFIEGVTAYRQIADVAAKKANQYVDGELNILIIDSESDLLHLMARSAAQEFSDMKRGMPPDSPLHRLNGIMVITSLFGVGRRRWNVDFAVTREPARRFGFRLLRVLAEIKVSGRNV